MPVIEPHRRLAIDAVESFDMTAGQAAKLLRVHTTTIGRWIEGGKLGGLKVGRRHRTNRAAIRRFLEDRNAKREERPSAAQTGWVCVSAPPDLPEVPS